MNDANLINEVINNNDNHLIMIRLLNYRDESQRKEIDRNFRRNANISMHQSIRNYIPNFPELPHLFELLNFK